MNFRPCIDLRDGHVVQIVGSTLKDGQRPVTHFESFDSAAEVAGRYRDDDLRGGHVIMLGPGSEQAAYSALAAFPGGMQVGGGVTPQNAEAYLCGGASHVIVTSYVFHEGRVDESRLEDLVAAVGRERLVLDLSCRRRDDAYYVVTDRWQHFTDVAVDKTSLEQLAAHCDEFLVHGVDVEGRRMGIEEDLVSMLGEASPNPVTYAGGARSLEDLDRVRDIGAGRVDLTIGSALDIFGGDVAYADVLAWHRREARG
ncbi:MAG: phosphoribosylformimino-5-aminoimidazole carboxamide ribotide isomerase [Gemmatimonadetes bacterium]|nr:phosphoribosylformimino-5-aminoimidazole carboxamide ribotide isomerase [Gemmatimonadota bacterium]